MPKRRASGNGGKLRGDGLLGADGDAVLEAWCTFLDGEGRGADPEHFVARNFLLDEGVGAARRDSYRAAGAMIVHADHQAWRAVHEHYLQDQVFLDADAEGPPPSLDPSVPDEIPETFRTIDPDSPFLHTADGVMLVRVEQVHSLSEKLGEDPAAIEELGRQVVAAGIGRAPTEEGRFNGLLEDWHAELDQRPVYVGFWEDLKDFFGTEPEEDADGWADTLRDRLGLAHIDPGARGRPLPIFVFRYPVRDVPRILRIGGDRRPLMPPTVLDGRFSEAFCPSPRGGLSGHVVNLEPQRGVVRRELLHPRPCYRAAHLWRVGTVHKAVDRAKLPEARAMHILQLRDETGREDYADGTDWDLFV